MTANECGESVASMKRRQDVNAWPRVYVALCGGAELYKPAKLDNYYTRCKSDLDPNNGIGISAKFVKFQVEHGCLIRLGVDTYGLDERRRQIEETQPQKVIQQELF